MEKTRTSFWRYIVAFLILWLSPLLISLVVILLLYVVNLIVPRYYQRSEIGISIIGNIAGVYLSCMWADAILLDKHRIFCAVNCILLALLNAYAVYAALSTPKDERDVYYGSVVLLISYIVEAVLFFKKRTASQGGGE
ncbi:MAG: hypothetical protein EOM14_11735 [Clostridia bacterium]|nr:hypothetical protein [Clostridia bacterium]